jgi:hypothetical protein
LAYITRLGHRGGGPAAGLVPADLPVELVDQLIQGGVQVLVRALGEHVVALDVNHAFGALSSFLFLLLFHCEQHPDVDDLVKVPVIRSSLVVT